MFLYRGDVAFDVPSAQVGDVPFVGNYENAGHAAVLRISCAKDDETAVAVIRKRTGKAGCANFSGSFLRFEDGVNVSISVILLHVRVICAIDAEFRDVAGLPDVQSP